MTDRDLSRFSPVSFAVAAVAVGVGTAAGLALVPVVGAYVGTLVGGFVAGLVREDRPLLEAGVAAVLAGLGILVAGTLVGNGVVAAVRALASVDPVTLLVSAGLSFGVGVFGAHFGDDLRDGLTEPVEEPPSRPAAVGSTGTQPRTTESSDAEQRNPERADEGSADRRPGESESSDLELERNE
ncbi:MAG: hypothetical protein V5A55_02905 [Halovenus sp.]